MICKYTVTGTGVPSNRFGIRWLRPILRNIPLFCGTSYLFTMTSTKMKSSLDSQISRGSQVKLRGAERLEGIRHAYQLPREILTAHKFLRALRLGEEFLLPRNANTVAVHERKKKKPFLVFDLHARDLWTILRVPETETPVPFRWGRRLCRYRARFMV